MSRRSLGATTERSTDDSSNSHQELLGQSALLSLLRRSRRLSLSQQGAESPYGFRG
jgi:hypothetical protein